MPAQFGYEYYEYDMGHAMNIGPPAAATPSGRHFDGDDHPDMYLLLVKSPSTATNTPYCVGRRTPVLPQLIGLSLLVQTAPIDGNISAELLFLEKERQWESLGPTSCSLVEGDFSFTSLPSGRGVETVALF